MDQGVDQHVDHDEELLCIVAWKGILDEISLFCFILFSNLMRIIIRKLDRILVCDIF